MPYNFQSFSKIEEEIAKAELARENKTREEELPEGADIETEELQKVEDDADALSSEDDLTGP